ncbi:MAG: SH3 domain-containing protein [Clostridia bacterium]|nr:SH3 domain-containing protein [Clostridia bacterium]
MKRFLQAFILTICLTLMTVSALAAEFAVTANAATVNMRAQPSKDSTLIATYQPGHWMEIWGQSGSWIGVRDINGRTGYISKNYLDMPNDMYANIRLVQNPQKNGFLNLRAQPSYSAPVLGIYYSGAPCIVLQDDGTGWVQVMIEGKTGYFRTEYLGPSRTMLWADDYATVVSANGGSVNLREGPGYGYRAIGQCRPGSYVMVLQRSVDSWWRISYNGMDGFMDVAFLRDGLLSPGQQGSVPTVRPAPQPTYQPQPDVSGGYAVVSNPKSSQILYLRSQPMAGTKELGQYRNGTRVKVLEQGTGWCKVQVQQDGKVGYMMTRYLNLVNLPAIPTKTVVHPQKTFVNLRSQPSADAGIMLRVPHGSQVTVIVPGASWTQVNYDNNIGYMMTMFLK